MNPAPTGPTDRRIEAKLRAGYGEMDTPCRPSRAAYTDDIDGEAAYVLALHRWHAYITLADLWGIPLP
jgi:hypothetical protein